MSFKERLYTLLCCIFCVLIVTGNMVYQKFVKFHLGFTFEISVGALFYPFTFMITDLIVEFYGAQRAKYCVQLGLLASVFVAGLILVFNSLEAANWSRVSDDTFNLVFGTYGLSFISSLLACYISQRVDITIYSFIRKITKGKYLWVRNSVSTSISLLIDTALVITILAFAEVLPTVKVTQLIFDSYRFKLFSSICSIPIFYLLIYVTRRFMQPHIPKVKQVSHESYI